jgi:hypothetical protein
MFKPFFIHRHHPAGKMPNRNPRGFTALISPVVGINSDFGDERNIADMRFVQMQVVFCSPKDQFVKKEGRRLAAEAHIESINKRDVPRMLAALSVLTKHNEFETQETDWYWVLKHLI